MAYNGFAIDKYLDAEMVTKQLDELTKKPIYSIKPEKLRDYVESKGYTLNSFAKKYNLAIGSCYNVLHKSKNVSASTLRKVYNAVQRCDTDNNNIENKDLKECHTQQEEVKVNINNKDLELLRALLVESLNDRDKALIRLFGGKIND